MSEGRRRLQTRLDEARARGLGSGPWHPRAADRLADAVASGAHEAKVLVVIGPAESGKSGLFVQLAARSPRPLVLLSGAQDRPLAEAAREELEAWGPAPERVLVIDALEQVPAWPSQLDALLSGLPPDLRVLCAVRTEAWLAATLPGHGSPLRDTRLLVHTTELGLERPCYELRPLSPAKEQPALHALLREAGSPAPAWEALPPELRAHLRLPGHLVAFHSLASRHPTESPSTWLGRLLDERLDSLGPSPAAPDDPLRVRRLLRELGATRDRPPLDGARLAAACAQLDAVAPGSTLAAALRTHVCERLDDGLELSALVCAPAGGAASSLLESALRQRPDALFGTPPTDRPPHALLHAAAEAMPWLEATFRTAEALALAEWCEGLLRRFPDERLPLAELLRTIGRLRARLDRWDEARAPLEESVRLARELAGPGDEAACRELVHSLDALAAFEVDDEREEEAAAAWDEALRLLPPDDLDERRMHDRASLLEARWRLRGPVSEAAMRRAIGEEWIALRHRLLLLRPADPVRSWELAGAVHQWLIDPATHDEPDARWAERRRLAENLRASLPPTTLPPPAGRYPKLGLVQTRPMELAHALGVGAQTASRVEESLREGIAREQERADWLRLQAWFAAGPSREEAIARLRAREPRRAALVWMTGTQAARRERLQQEPRRHDLLTDFLEAASAELHAPLTYGRPPETCAEELRFVLPLLRAEGASGKPRALFRLLVGLRWSATAALRRDERDATMALLAEATELLGRLGPDAQLPAAVRESFLDQVEALELVADSMEAREPLLALRNFQRERLRLRGSELPPLARAYHRSALVRRELRETIGASTASEARGRLVALLRLARALVGGVHHNARQMLVLRAATAVLRFDHGSLSQRAFELGLRLDRLAADRGASVSPGEALPTCQYLLVIATFRRDFATAERCAARLDAFDRGSAVCDWYEPWPGPVARFAPPTIEWIGLLRLAQGRSDEARALLEEGWAMRTGPDAPEGIRTRTFAACALRLALVHRRCGDVAAGARWFARAAELLEIPVDGSPEALREAMLAEVPRLGRRLHELLDLELLELDRLLAPGEQPTAAQIEVARGRALRWVQDEEPILQQAT